LLCPLLTRNPMHTTPSLPPPPTTFIPFPPPKGSIPFKLWRVLLSCFYINFFFPPPPSFAHIGFLPYFSALAGLIWENQVFSHWCHLVQPFTLFPFPPFYKPRCSFFFFPLYLFPSPLVPAFSSLELPLLKPLPPLLICTLFCWSPKNVCEGVLFFFFFDESRSFYLVRSLAVPCSLFSSPSFDFRPQSRIPLIFFFQLGPSWFSNDIPPPLVPFYFVNFPRPCFTSTF